MAAIYQIISRFNDSGNTLDQFQIYEDAARQRGTRSTEDSKLGITISSPTLEHVKAYY